MRVDLLTDGERLWLGELTVYNLGGVFPDCGHRADSNLSRAWDIGGSWFLTTQHQSPWPCVGCPHMTHSSNSSCHQTCAHYLTQ